MDQVEAKITSKGQITLPAQVRARLNVGPGDRVVFAEAGDGKIVVRSRSGTLADLRGVLGDKVTIPKGADIHRWIDEARSRAWPRSPKRHTRSKR